MSRLLKLNPEEPAVDQVREAVEMIREGAICAYPTETFYGLGVDVGNEAAIKRLYDLKRRDPGNPIAVIVSDRDMLASIVQEVPDRALVLIDLFWPGPLTILFRTKSGGKIGIRISSHPVATALVRGLGCPLSTTSANLAGFPPSSDPNRLRGYFGDKIDLIIDGGALPPSLGSTVVDVTDEKVAIIREGVIPAGMIFKSFKGEGEAV
ncbi:MAG: threonylcarbamoyl-AMP synthase [Deltaproteobacteria bacterium]|nr:threonylcarbamoyl-AMP synthase [Deltaproteobacteria bacterium]MBI4373965.1 threonylcarbamoyl-AMP synthase [Deltaproteobacteria bacterium]